MNVLTGFESLVKRVVMKWKGRKKGKWKGRKKGKWKGRKEGGREERENW
jgi:hypothetical protein